MPDTQLEKKQETLPQRHSKEIAPAEWDLMKDQAALLIKSGFIPIALNTPEKVIAVMLTARELNIGKMEALRSINIIQGKPCMSAQLMLALAQRTHELEGLDIKEDDEGAHVMIMRKGQSAYTAHFGPTQAKALGLSGKDNYQKQAATMYRWRAMAEAVRFTFPDAVCGIYTPEEMGAPVTITQEGELVVDMDAPPTLPAKPAGADRLINEAELRLLHARITDSGISKEDVKKYAKQTYGRDSSKDLTVSELAGILKWLVQEPEGA